MEKVSALMDGELGDDEARREITRLKQDGVGGDIRYCWDTYHLIGDALRGNGLLTPSFGRSMSQRLAAEPTILAPPRQRVTRKIYTYAMSAAASVAGVALVVWVAMSTGSSLVSPVQPELAKAPAADSTAASVAASAGAEAQIPSSASVVAVASDPEVSVPSDGQSTEYLLAHQGISPSTAIQGVAPYIRTVSNISTVEPAPR